MKTAYFVENYGKTSETFIVECLHGLSKNDMHGEIYVDTITSTLAPPINFNLVETQFSSKHNKITHYLKLFLKGKANRRRIFNYKKALAFNSILKELKTKTPQIAYIEFGFNAVLVREALVKLNIPFVVTFHGKDASQDFSDLIYVEEIQKVFRDASKIIAVSHHIKRRLVLQGCEDEKIKVIYNTINFQFRDLNFSNKSSETIIFVGRLVEKKNPIALIHSFSIVKKIIKDAKLIIVGDGPLFNDCVNLVKKLNLIDSVVFKGLIENKEVFKLLAKSNIYAQHSITSSRGDQEGFPITLLEAQALGLPVVATIHNGFLESVEEGKSGFLVPEFDYEKMAEKLVYLLKNKEFADKMGDYAKHRAITKFTPEIRLKAIIAVLQEVAQN